MSNIPLFKIKESFIFRVRLRSLRCSAAAYAPFFSPLKRCWWGFSSPFQLPYLCKVLLGDASCPLDTLLHGPARVGDVSTLYQHAFDKDTVFGRRENSFDWLSITIILQHSRIKTNPLARSLRAYSKALSPGNAFSRDQSCYQIPYSISNQIYRGIMNVSHSSELALNSSFWIQSLSLWQISWTSLGKSSNPPLPP